MVDSSYPVVWLRAITSPYYFPRIRPLPWGLPGKGWIAARTK